MERTVRRVWPTMRLPSGDCMVTTRGKAPEVRATTLKRSVSLRLVRSRRRLTWFGGLPDRLLPPGNSSLSLRTVTTTWTGYPVALRNVTGIWPARAVSVIERSAGVWSRPSWSFTPSSTALR